MKYWLFSFFILVLTGCHRDGWHHSLIQNGNATYDMAKLIHKASSPSSGMDLEFSRRGSMIHGYINVHAFELPSFDGDLYATTLTIETDLATKTFVIPLLEGGQRARLTDDCLEYLLQTLELKPHVTLSSGYFKEEVNSSRFVLHMDALQRSNSRIRPQHMINFELY